MRQISRLSQHIREIGAFGVIAVGVTVLGASLYEAFRGSQGAVQGGTQLKEALEKVHKYVETDSRLARYTRDESTVMTKISDSEIQVEYGIAHQGTTGKIISRLHVPSLAILWCQAKIGTRTFSVNRKFF